MLLGCPTLLPTCNSLGCSLGTLLDDSHMQSLPGSSVLPWPVKVSCLLSDFLWPCYEGRSSPITCSGYPGP